MDDKDKSFWRSKRDTSGTINKLDTHTRRCPQGHPMAADWTECPYCKASVNVRDNTGSVGSETRFTNMGSPGGNGGVSGTDFPDPPPGQRRTTRVFDSDGGAAAPGAAPSASGERKTKVFSEPADPARAREPAPPGRPLTGVLFTFTWSRLGQLFQVYSGRNFAGTANSTRDGEPIEIIVGEDSTMSGTHFLILNQAPGKYRIKDWNSTNGTLLNGELVDPEGNDLQDDARIVAGTTLFVFKRIQPPGKETATTPNNYSPVAAGKDDSP